MTVAWHAPDDLLERFVADPTQIDSASASSLEAHLVACDRCRVALNSQVDATEIERSWSSIEVRIDQPRRSALERVLGILGVPDATARLVGATPAFTVAGVAAVLLIAATAVAGSLATDTSGAFLVVAPVLPLLTVAAAFAPAADPAGEAGVATPLHGLGLVLRRSAVVLSAVFLVLAAADLAIGDLDAPVVAWLLPALALVAGALALSTWFRPEVSTAGLGLGWMVVVSVARWVEAPTAGYAESAVFGPGGQVVALAALLGAAGVVVLRRARFQMSEVRW